MNKPLIEDKQQLFSMDLLDENDVYDGGSDENWNVLRIPGGWIFTNTDIEFQKTNSSIFVPYSEEFKK